MKRTLVAVSALAAVCVGAFQPPARTPLPNFDVRTERAAAAADIIPPEHVDAVAGLQARVPELEIKRSRILNAPNFFSSRSSFLTGPDAAGLGVSSETAQKIPKDDPHRAVKAFLNEHAGLLGYGAEVLNGARVNRDYVAAHNGLHTTIWQQELNGIAVFDAILMAHITRQGELVNLYTEWVPDANRAALHGLKGVAPAAAAPRLSAEEAIAISAANVGDEISARSVTGKEAAQGASRKQTFVSIEGLKGDQEAEIVWLPLNSGLMRLCWRTIISSKSRSEMFLIVVDAETGEVLVRRCLTNYLTNSTYNVYTSDSPSPFSPGYPNPGNPTQPPIIPRTLVTFPALNTNASPNGWIDDTVNETRGNNVDAHTDRNDDDQPDLPRPAGNPFHVFDFPLDLTQAPTAYSPAAVVNLFYWNNFMHDKLYELGFTEAAGNFQNTNFGRGGFGNDAVQADAQDGGGFNNANMGTPPDGSPPRMQMYIFDGPTPDRDGDLDAEVMCHEYTHGLSNRRVGGGIGISALQPSGMGEGWSDFYGLSLLSATNDAIDGVWATGGYVTFDIIPNFRDNYYFGIRRYPYTTNLLKNPLTFKDIDPAQISPHTGIPRNPIFGPFNPFSADEVHNQGEVWCVTLWELRANLIAKYGGAVGNQLALQLVSDAMPLCPPNPTFLQSRDAILQADRVNNNNANYNEIWRAFAKRGMGSSATSPDSSTTAGVHESFDFPGLSLVSTVINDSLTGNNNGAIDNNECVEIFITLRNNSVTNERSILSVLSSTNAGVTISQPSSAYPDLVPNATAQNITPFRITTAPGFLCGTPITFTLITTSMTDTPEARTNVFQLRSGFVSLVPTLLNNNIPVAIPDANTNGVDSTINVSGMSGVLGKVTVSLYLTHTFDGDLLIELVGPDGTRVALSKNEGAFGDNFGSNCTPFTARTTFDDNAPTTLALANPPYVGSFRPDEPLVIFAGKTGASLNGAWKLHITDLFQIDTGTLQCWTLALYPTTCTDGGGPCAADLAVSASATPSPAYLGQNLTYNVIVTNTRPLSAGAVVLTNVLPANVNFISATSAQASCSFTGGIVRCDFGTLSNGMVATATIVVQPTAVGSVTNVFVAGGATLDANPANNSATVITDVNVAVPVLVADGAQLIAESFAPATGGIEAGETVTVNLALQNNGSAATADLVATLLDGNGVSGSSGSQDYGTIAVSANATRSFTFTATGNPRDSISAVLQLQDGAQDLGTVTFHFTLGGEVTFGNAAAITINELGAATPYPSTINVSGVVGTISKVRVTFTKLSHTYPDDIDALLVGPHGQKLILMSDCGGGIPIVNKTLTFDGAAAGKLPDESVINAGTYLPSDYVSGTEPSGDLFPSAPVGPLASSFLAFNFTDANGAWSLYINDDGGNDGGSIAGGWALGITTVIPVNPVANLSIAANASPNPAIVGEPLTYLLTVANTGPSNAPSVVVSDTIPAGTSFISATPSQGSASFAAGVVTANLGSMSNGATATVTIAVTPTSTGSKTNSATVSAASADLDLSNNSVTTVLSANNPVADLAVSVVASPATVFTSSNVTFSILITNRGPNHADSVQLTNRLSSAFTFVSATNSQDVSTFAGGIITCYLGSLPANGSATATIVATAVNAGSATNLFAVASPTSDPAPANNSTNVATTINPLAPLIVASGVALTSESFAPANGAIESGETVTVNFGLRNAGTADAGNVVATLQSSGGVSSPSAPQNYGAMIANGPTVSHTFSFLASGAAGSTLTATLQLQDGAQNLGTVIFNFTLSANRPFTNNQVIIIPLQGQATNYPSTNIVSGIAGTVSKVTVTVKQLTHTFPEDIDMLLVGPAGQKALLMSDAGAGNPVNGITLTFDDSAAGLPFASTIASGTYHPTDFAPGDSFPAPAPAGPYGTNLSVFNGVNPNGTWSLFVFDDAAGDQGRIDGGWTLNIQTATPVVPSADVAVSTAAPAAIVPGATFSNIITVANYGPAVATGIVVTDALPAGFSLGPVTVSQGSFSSGSGLVTANVGTLNVGSTATITIVGSGTVNMTNSAAVTATQADANVGNNSASSVILITTPTLSIRRSGTNVVIAWPAPSTGYILESSASVFGPWLTVSATINTVNGEKQVVVPATDTMFYRLRKP